MMEPDKKFADMTDAELVQIAKDCHAAMNSECISPSDSRNFTGAVKELDKRDYVVEENESGVLSVYKRTRCPKCSEELDSVTVFEKREARVVVARDWEPEYTDEGHYVDDDTVECPECDEVLYHGPDGKEWAKKFLQNEAVSQEAH